MDWFGIIAAIVIFGISAFLEKDRKKGRTRHAAKPQVNVPESSDREGSVYAETFSGRVAEPARISPYVAAADVADTENKPADKHAGMQDHHEGAVPERRKRRISGREMILNSELLKPKYFER